jgi:hypothetical protein
MNIPISILQGWGRDLGQIPTNVPSARSGNTQKGGLTQEQEKALAHGIQSEFVNQRKFWPAQLIQMMAVEIHG